MKTEFHIDFKQICEGLHDHHEFLVVYNFEWLFYVIFHEVEKFRETFFKLSSWFRIVLHIVIAVKLSDTKSTSEILL